MTPFRSIAWQVQIPVATVRMRPSDRKTLLMGEKRVTGTPDG